MSKREPKDWDVWLCDHCASKRPIILIYRKHPFPNPCWHSDIEEASDISFSLRANPISYIGTIPKKWRTK